MRNAKTKIVVTHISAWCGLVAYHIITGILLDKSLAQTTINTLLFHGIIYAPTFYFIYFFVLKPFNKYRSVILLIIFTLTAFAIYTVVIYLFTKYAFPFITRGANQNFKLDLSFIMEIIDLFFLSYFLYALLYWYAQRNIDAQKTLREKEAQEFKTAQQLHELEGKALRAQMNPHFIFNSLNSVQYFIVDKDMATANRYLGRFGHLIRQTLDNSAHSMIPLEQEKQYLDTYLELEQMRRPGAFDYEINVDEELDMSAIMLPPMLLQPYVENAVKHGIPANQLRKGLIVVSLQKKDNHLVCTITDNGLGREATKALKASGGSTHQSKGMGITEERIAVLNKNQGAGIRHNISDTHDNEGNVAGTKIEIIFPLNFAENKPAL